MTDGKRDDDPDRGEDIGSRETYASPPCLMHEFEEDYMGYMNHGEIVELLNVLLEGERAGAKVLGEMSARLPESGTRDVLHGVGRDEGYFCTMLKRQIERFGGDPSRRVGDFYDKIMALDGAAERVDLLNRGQAWVVRKLDEALPKVRDDDLHRELMEMRDVHVRNIEKCEAISV